MTARPLHLLLERTSLVSSVLLAMLVSLLVAGPLTANASGAFLADANGCSVWDQHPLANERVTWSGSCKDGKADGDGRVEWINDGKTTSSEEGSYQAGRMNGHGVINYSNGTRFEGMVVEGVAQVPEAERFALKGSETGSHIPRGEVTGLGVPPDKTYAELSRDQQNLIKGQYEQMKPGDEPPYPAYGTHAIYDAIHRAQQSLLVDGKLDMVVQVNDEGKATSVTVLASPDPKMTQVAANILIIQHYKPALCSGAPCAMAFPFRMNFVTVH